MYIRETVEGFVDDGQGDFGLLLNSTKGFRLDVFLKEHFDLVVQLGAQGAERGIVAITLHIFGVYFCGVIRSRRERSLCHDEATHLIPKCMRR